MDNVLHEPHEMPAAMFSSEDPDYKNVFIKDCIGYDVFFVGDSPHRLENAFIESRAARTLEVSQSNPIIGGSPSMAVLKNVRFRRTAEKPGEVRVSRNGKLTLDRCTLEGPFNFTATPGAEVAALRTAVLGKSHLLLFPNVLWQGEHNHYDLGSLRVGPTSFGEKTFSEFQKAIASEGHSVWNSAAPSADVGADRFDGLKEKGEALWKQVKGSRQ